MRVFSWPAPRQITVPLVAHDGQRTGTEYSRDPWNISGGVIQPQLSVLLLAALDSLFGYEVWQSAGRKAGFQSLAS